MSQSNSTTATSTKTLWFWPSGIFPRRVPYYLRAKELSAKDLDQEKLSLIPCHVDLQSQDLELESILAYEKRPPGFSLPVLRVVDYEKESYIAQSSSILEYLEDIFPDSKGYKNLRGNNAVQHAKIRDIVQLTNELLTWCNVQVRHSTDFSLLWSGMTKEQQSMQAAEDAKIQVAKLLGKLESWVDNRGGISLVGAVVPTIADVSFAAAKASMEDIYGIQLLRGFHKLEAWWNRYEASSWFVTKSEMESIERGTLNLVVRQAAC